MNPEIKTMKAMQTPAAKAKEMKPDTEAEIIIDGAIRLTTQCLLARSFDVFCRHDDE